MTLLVALGVERHVARRPVVSQSIGTKGCAGAIIERIVHRADILRIEGKSWRLKESEERAAAAVAAATNPEARP